MKRVLQYGLTTAAGLAAGLWGRASAHIEYSPGLVLCGCLLVLVALVLLIIGCVLVTAAQQATLCVRVGPLSISKRDADLWPPRGNAKSEEQ